MNQYKVSIFNDCNYLKKDEYEHDSIVVKIVISDPITKKYINHYHISIWGITLDMLIRLNLNTIISCASYEQDMLEYEDGIITFRRKGKDMVKFPLEALQLKYLVSDPSDRIELEDFEVCLKN